MSGSRNPHKDGPARFTFVWRNSGVILNEVGCLYGQSDSNASKTKLRIYPGLYKVAFADNLRRRTFSLPAEPVSAAKAIWCTSWGLCSIPEPK
jgi:hypothetical protein